MNNIEVRPFFIESVQNRNTFNIIDGKKVGTTKAPGGRFSFFIGDSATTKRLAIDLSHEVPNPYHNDKTKLPVVWRNLDIDKQEFITKQQELEIKYNKEPGFLTNESFNNFDVDSRTLRSKNRTYLQSFMHTFEDKKNVLRLDNLHDEVCYEALKGSKFFAMSYDEAVKNSNNVRFYISH